MTILKISPMLVQYLVGLCCIKWDPKAIDVTIGDMVLDPSAEKERDVDVTVTVSADAHNKYAFKAYEVKRECTPLDVSKVEQLCLKLLDMPSVTHRAIVSASGFTESAIKKAVRHGITLYEFRQWTRPLQEQFPALMMKGTIEECFPINKFLLHWIQPRYAIVARKAKSDFSVQPTDKLFDVNGCSHRRFSIFSDFQNELLLRSTEILFCLEPAVTISRTFPIPFLGDENVLLGSPIWPHTHTIDVGSDEVYVKVGEKMVRIDFITITGHLQWQRDKVLYYVLQEVKSNEAFAGAIISTQSREGNMTALVFSPRTREIGINFIRLEEKHHNAIRNLKVDMKS